MLKCIVIFFADVVKNQDFHHDPTEIIFYIYYQAKMPNITKFKLFKGDELLLFFVFCVCKLNIFWF